MPVRKYQVERLIGKGGMGSVYLARMVTEDGFSKEVALKVLSIEATQNGQLLKRFRDEARLLGLVNHRAILKVDSLVRLEGRWAVVMEHVDGVDLRTLRLRGGLPAGCAMEVGHEIASALHASYTQPGPDGTPLRLVHRDIKPGNIMVGRDGSVKLLDFGIAQAQFEGREAETTLAILGTLGYMSPERLDGYDEPGGDTFALSVSLIEVISGQRLGRTSPNEDRHRAKIAQAGELLAGAGLDAEHPITRLLLSGIAYEPEERPDFRTFSQVCRTLRGQSEDPWLEEWLEQSVDFDNLSAPEPDEEGDDLESTPLSGRTLVEAESGAPASHDVLDDTAALLPGTARGLRPDEGPSAPAPPLDDTRVVAPTPRRRLPIVALVAVLGVAGALGAWALFEGDSGNPPPAHRSGGAPAPRGPPAGAQPMSATGTGPEPPASGPVYRVKVNGEAQKVVLVSPDGGRHTQGQVPPGTYTILATFPGRSEAEAGSLKVSSDVTLRCEADRALCEVSP